MGKVRWLSKSALDLLRERPEHATREQVASLVAEVRGLRVMLRKAREGLAGVRARVDDALDSPAAHLPPEKSALRRPRGARPACCWCGEPLPEHGQRQCAKSERWCADRPNGVHSWCSSATCRASVLAEPSVDREAKGHAMSIDGGEVTFRLDRPKSFSEMGG